MKKYTTVTLLAALLSASSLSAQSTGDSAAKSSTAGRNNTWQNWVFAGGAIVAAAVGITVVLLNQGSSSNSH